MPRVRTRPVPYSRIISLPIVEAGQALLVDDDYALNDLVTLTQTPGHSPHHCCINLHSKGQRAVVTGDLMHHAIQCREPDLAAAPDWAPTEGIKLRRNFLTSVAETDTLILPIHFPAPTAGLVTADGKDRFHYRYTRNE
jgi:glyoxylase-like metal-dependent hydrolase (beta-lactamase superfamily II)